MNIEDALKDIQAELHQIRLSAVDNHTLWTIQDIGRYLGTTTKNLHNQQVTSRPGFPLAIVIPLSKDGRATKRWKAKEIISWAERIREPKRTQEISVKNWQ